jgi:hypothetical protein
MSKGKRFIVGLLSVAALAVSIAPAASSDVGPGTHQCSQPSPSNPNCPNHH